MSELQPVDMRVLAALPMDVGAGRWLTPAAVAGRLGLDPEVARSCLVRLRCRGFVEDDGERPQAFARTPAGEHRLETWPLEAPPS